MFSDRLNGTSLTNESCYFGLYLKLQPVHSMDFVCLVINYLIEKMKQTNTVSFSLKSREKNSSFLLQGKGKKKLTFVLRP